jgi:MYXO-CTERM domain-containing protein
MSRTRWLPIVAALAAGPASAFDGAFVVIEGGAWDVDNGPIEYVLEPNGVDDISGNADLDAVRDAFRAWECVEGTKLRFQEGDEPGPGEVNGEDGLNTLFWDETNEYQLGPATLGVTIGDATPGQPRRSADIVFNGFDSQWSVDGSAVDVQSIALHEIGHFVGLDHPCDKASGQETNCNGGDRSVMTPVWDGALERTPKPDDEEGVRALYPADGDDGGCDGPRRKGERCTCDGECVEGLVCASVGGAQATCAETCASDDANCGDGARCVLDPPEGDDPAPGVCVATSTEGAPPGAVCTNGAECATGTCALLFDVTLSLCQDACDKDTDCDAGRCFKGFCLGVAEHEECPAPGDGCGCTQDDDDASAASGAVALASLAAFFGLRRAGRRRGRA